MTAATEANGSTAAGAFSNGRPGTRTARLSAIEQALMTHVVTSQSQLSSILAAQGIEVTQATLSRDLDEMNATKTRMPDGTVAYTLDDQPPRRFADSGVDEKAEAHMARVLSGLVTSVARANNLIVVHTSSGAAQYVGSVIDRQTVAGVLGCIAGDDTVMIVCSDDDVAAARADWLLNIA
ncbi:arginine repressor [Bifidobacterium choloepi]|uniref:Arginine repressor n=1 Tax=Bifidobacterium choloepi TaxID=2614131 RepID=A0A6I5NNE7_9BIFI|nr:arginine repressor [Bifidobacterium choloepi]NEG70242.1 arginine repressor [Bifidobacterium choloepi]